MNFLTSIRLERLDVWLVIENLRQKRFKYKPGSVDLGSKRGDFLLEMADLRPKKIDFISKKANFGP